MNLFDKEKLGEKFEKQLKKGIYIRKTWDIRVVENFFKKLFGLKRKKGEGPDDTKRKRRDHKSNH